MRFTHDDHREALTHKDWLENLTIALVDEEIQQEPGPATQASLHGLPNVVTKSVVREDIEATRLRVAVALGLIPAFALLEFVGEAESLTPVDLAALRLREAFIGEPAHESEARLRSYLQEVRFNEAQSRPEESQSPQNAENDLRQEGDAGEPGSPVQ